jgi:lysophospholipase L1-like esterase
MAFHGWKINFFIFLFGLLLSLALAEAVTRALPKISSEFKLSSYRTDNPNIKTLNQPDWYPKYRPSSIVGYEMIPKSAANINCYGMIGKEYGLRKANGTYRILVIGDSITQFDWYVRSIEEKLNNTRNLNYKFELWNAGVCGYEVTQYGNYIRFKGIKYNPDMVIIGFCLNDFNVSGTVITYKDANGFKGYYYSGYALQRMVPINNFLFRYSYLYRYLYINIDRLLAKFSAGRYLNEKERIGTESLREIKTILQNKNIKLLGVIFPYLKPLEEYRQYEKEEYESMQRVLTALNIDYLDLHSVFPKEKEKLTALRACRCENDYIHPSKEGHEIAANAIYSYLIGKYFARRN